MLYGTSVLLMPLLMTALYPPLSAQLGRNTDLVTVRAPWDDEDDSTALSELSTLECSVSGSLLGIALPCYSGFLYRSVIRRYRGDSFKPPSVLGEPKPCRTKFPDWSRLGCSSCSNRSACVPRPFNADRVDAVENIGPSTETAELQPLESTETSALVITETVEQPPVPVCDPLRAQFNRNVN